MYRNDNQNVKYFKKPTKSFAVYLKIVIDLSLNLSLNKYKK